MRFRFLFVDDRGEEVYVSSTEDLLRYVRSGSLREEALLYDSLTREWAPARTHPTFARFVELEGSSEGDAVDEGSGPEPTVEPSDPEVVPPTGAPPATAEDIETVLSALEAVPEDEVQVDTLQLFMKEQERERWDELGDEWEEGVSLLEGDHPEEAQRHAPISGSWGDTPPEPGDPGFESFLNAQRRWGRSQPPRAWGEGGVNASRGAAESLQGDPSLPMVTPSAPTVSGASTVTLAVPARSSRPVTRWFRRMRARNEQRSRNAAGRQLAFLILLLLVGGWGVAEAWGVSPLRAGGLSEEGPTGSSTAPIPLNPSMEAVQVEAFQDMVMGMEHLRRTLQVGEPPEVWMGGPYLSNALGFPEVRDYWQRYLDYVRTLRDSEEDLFRNGFVTRLRLQGVSGPALSIRLARALQDFEDDAPRREATYAGMEELARSALGLHDFLLTNAHRIRYAPVDQGVNDDPILEAVPEDEATKDALWARIERLVQALDGVADVDPRSRRDVSRSVLGSLALPQDGLPSQSQEVPRSPPPIQ